jgi:bifunctional DNA-binding transcriptional regulator/antitoxin component of YhaV-PrlF toxin-antitoxin module
LLAVLKMPVLAKSKVWNCRRTTIPVEVRKLLELRDGDEVERKVVKSG